VNLSDWTETVVPSWVMALVVGVLTLCLIIGVPAARAAGRRRGHRLAHPEAYTKFRDRAKETALFLAALLPSVLVWLAVMGVSFIGLTGFAADVMQWRHWTNMLVPLSLDGISVSFGAWAFVAVKRGRHPGRAYKIVLAAATMSAVLNFVHGRDQWSIWAGLYLAFLSMAGMAMFHELLDQFMAAYDDEVALKTRYPRFGQRWLYAPISTFSARRAWIVHPPEEGVRPSVRNALDHLQAVRDAKRQRRLDGALRVREEAQAQLVAVEARAEVRRAKAGGARRPGSGGLDSVPHRPIAMPQQQHPFQPPQHPVQPQAHTMNPSPAQPSIEPPQPPAKGRGKSAPAPRTAESVLDPDTRSQLESIMPTQGRDVLGRRPTMPQDEPSNGHDVIARRQALSGQRLADTHRMIAEAMAMGEEVTPEMVNDFVQRQFGGQRPSQSWARDQIFAVRSRDAVGVDADLV
jgi:hypothetical protein